ncbi:MAG TPA: GreA/GreB family elongation factor [Luteolibacter sp.]|nr:GreA/GreB family elongation factor [Luteolibacter sp.]
MHPEVAKLVEAGRIPAAVGERLSQLAPGNFCLHKSFGAGKVVDWDLPGKKVVIDFEKSRGQTMELQFAFNKTEWIAADDFRAQKIAQIGQLSSMASDDPVALVVHLLESHGGTMTVDQLEAELSGSVISADSFKRWWESAKKGLRDSRRVVVPARRNEPIVLRSADQSPAQALLAEFEQARDIKGMIKALEAITADIGAFDQDTETLKRLLADIDEGAKKASRVQLGQALQLVAARDEVVGSSKALSLDDSALRLADLLAKQVGHPLKLADEIGALPAARQRAVYEAFPAAYGHDWVEQIVRVFDHVGSRGVTEIARLLLQQGKMPALVDHLKSAIARRDLGSDALIWVCRERKDAALNVFGADVGAAILNLLENDHLADGPRKTSRLQGILSDDKALLSDLVGMMDQNEARNFARRLLDCPVFGELEKKSLMARIIKARPETSELVSDSGSGRQETLLVSWESLEKKKAELEDIVRNKIPQNINDIKIARSYGDLRENFEYKSAKDMEKFLSHRRTALEKEIHQARGTDFKGMDASKVNIGTVVTLVDDAGALREITVLGAWDSDPEKALVSYLSDVGKSLMGRVVGDMVEVRDLQTESLRQCTIRSIRPYNP